ncbi:MAG: flagellar motor switch phosphatase FliY [Negativicutes bacterium]
MSDGFLSQEEIDALLRADPVMASPAIELTDIERDAMGEIGNISMGSAATTLSILLDRRVSITTPKVSISNLREIKEQYPLPYVVIEVGYTHGLHGGNLLAMQERDTAIIADLMMGGDGSNPPSEMNELYMSAVTEAMNQMMGSTATAMSTVFKKKVDISPPKVNVMNFADNPSITNLTSDDQSVVRVSFRMEVEGLIDGEIMQVLSIDFAREMVSGLMGSIQAPGLAPKPTPKPLLTEAVPVKEEVSNPKIKIPNSSFPVENMPSKSQYQQNITVQPVQFAPLTVNSLPVSDPNISLIMDVPLQVTVELGRTRKLIRDILELVPGSIIELDKLAGEPVDVLVNGKLIAKGEVVVIDENFGVRITEIVSQLERTNNLQ